MRKKTHFILLVLLAIQLAFIALVYRPQQVNQQSFIFFPDIRADNIIKIIIEDEQGQSIILSKDKNDTWNTRDTLNGPYPADTAQIDKLLDKLTNLRSDHLVTRTHSSHYRLEVAGTKFSRSLLLETETGPLPLLYFGTSVDHQSIHARLAKNDSVYVVKGISTWQLPIETESWLLKEKTLLGTKEGDEAEKTLLPHVQEGLTEDNKE